MSNQQHNIVTFNDLVTKILNQRLEVQQHQSLLVAISGIDSSGKGYITEKLVAEVNEKGVYAIAINIDPWLTLPEIRYNPENPGEHFYHYGFRFDEMFQHNIYGRLQVGAVRIIAGANGNSSLNLYFVDLKNFINVGFHYIQPNLTVYF